MCSDDVFELFIAHSLEPQSEEARPGEATIELEGARVAVAHRRQESEPLRGQPVHHETNDVGRRRIEPLHVVERQHHGRLGRGGAKDRERAARDGDPIRRPLFRRAQQRELERPALRLGKGVEHGVGHAVEEVAEPQKREGALRFRRSADKHAI